MGRCGAGGEFCDFKEIGSRITISQADVNNFYAANKASFNLAENMVHLARILVTPGAVPNLNNLKNSKAQNDTEARSKIQMLDMRVRQGEDFGLLAQNYSEDQYAPNGGDVGSVPESNIEKASPELLKMISTMTPGQVSNIIKTQDGYSIIKLIARQNAGQRQLSDPRVQEEIRQEIFQAKHKNSAGASFGGPSSAIEVLFRVSKQRQYLIVETRGGPIRGNECLGHRLTSDRWRARALGGAIRVSCSRHRAQ